MDNLNSILEIIDDALDVLESDDMEDLLQALPSSDSMFPSSRMRTGEPAENDNADDSDDMKE